MRNLIIIISSIFVFCAVFMLESIDFPVSHHLTISQAHAHGYGTGRRVARRTARRTARRVSRRHNYYGAGVAIGTTVVALPPACSRVVVNGVSYYNCGGTYYQQAYNGPDVVYMVVQPPN